jgi:beta-phosphoglucomutase-like phosphatase (HAD superfamily)
MSEKSERRSFIFDLDGVLINNEPYWEKHKKELFAVLFGEEISSKMGSTVGLNMQSIYERAVALGATASEQQLRDSFHKHALSIYGTVPITEGVNELGELLVRDDYAIGIVSASQLVWMNLVINRLTFRESIDIIISLEERKDLPHKPAPEGYLEAMRGLAVSPSSTIILEDSNAGIASAKAAGAYVIGLKQNLLEGYKQEGADRYVNTVEEIFPLIKSFS